MADHPFDTFTTQEGAVYRMRGATCPRCSEPSDLKHITGSQGMFQCPDCRLVYDEPNFTEDAYVETVATECDCCGGRFDVSLPDDDEHRYHCSAKDCDNEFCFDCKVMDKYGNDWCPDHEDQAEFDEGD